MSFGLAREGANGSLARIDLGRPDEGNALTRPMIGELGNLLRELGNAPEVRVIALGARGAQFCMGRDKGGESTAGMTAWDMRHQMMGVVLELYKAIGDAPVPVVACVHGDAIGVGAALAAACDITLASDGARFAFPEIEHDMPPTLAMCAAMGKVQSKALLHLIYSGDSIDAAEAVRMGLASKALPAASFAAEADAFVRKLAGRSRLTLETIKRYHRHAAQLSPDMAAEYAGTLLALVRSAGK